MSIGLQMNNSGGGNRIEGSGFVHSEMDFVSPEYESPELSSPDLRSPEAEESRSSLSSSSNSSIGKNSDDMKKRCRVDSRRTIGQFAIAGGSSARKEEHIKVLLW